MSKYVFYFAFGILLGQTVREFGFAPVGPAHADPLMLLAALVWFSLAWRIRGLERMADRDAA